jgi:hypothetical protein
MVVLVFGKHGSVDIAVVSEFGQIQQFLEEFGVRCAVGVHVWG